MFWLLSSTIFAFACLVVLIIACYKEILHTLSRVCSLSRDFIGENSGFFTIGFIVLFGLEEAALIIAALFFKVPKFFAAIIAIFALIVVITASLQKFIWEHKYQYANEEAKQALTESKLYLKEIKQLIDENETLKRRKKK